MRHSSSSKRHKVWSLLRYITLGLLLIIVSACHRAANLIPAGYGDVFNDAARASTAARIDYPIIYAAGKSDTSITFRVTKYGERTWFWQEGYWKLPPWWKSFRGYRIGLINDEDDKPICITPWTRPDPEHEVTEIPCRFNIKPYLSKPLAAVLFYGVGGDESHFPADDDLQNGVVSRMYYIITNPFLP